MTRILVTGAGGFIAGHAARRFASRGMQVVGVARHALQDRAFERVHAAALGDSLADILERESPDAVLHCAYDPTPGADNVAGTTLWFEQARERKVPLQILLSSLSAGPAALAEYGRDKYALEQSFSAAQQVSYRLGLVIGPGGLFARMVDAVRRARLVPLLDRGRAAVYVIGIDDLTQVLCDCVADAGRGRRGRVIHAQQPTRHSLAAVLRGIRLHYGYRAVFVPVPSLPVLWVAQFLERFPLLRLPVSVTNLRGLRQSRHETFGSDFPEFGYPERSLDDLLRAAAGAAHTDRWGDR